MILDGFISVACMVFHVAQDVKMFSRIQEHPPDDVFQNVPGNPGYPGIVKQHESR